MPRSYKTRVSFRSKIYDSTKRLFQFNKEINATFASYPNSKRMRNTCCSNRSTGRFWQLFCCHRYSGERGSNNEKLKTKNGLAKRQNCFRSVAWLRAPNCILITIPLFQQALVIGMPLAISRWHRPPEIPEETLLYYR